MSKQSTEDRLATLELTVAAVAETTLLTARELHEVRDYLGCLSMCGGAAEPESLRNITEQVIESAIADVAEADERGDIPPVDVAAERAVLQPVVVKNQIARGRLSGELAERALRIGGGA